MPDYVVYLRVDASVVVRAESEKQAQEAVMAMSTERVCAARSFETWVHKIDSVEEETRTLITPIDAAREIDARTLGEGDIED